jgi:hypothetical protein
MIGEEGGEIPEAPQTEQAPAQERRKLFGRVPIPFTRRPATQVEPSTDVGAATGAGQRLIAHHEARVDSRGGGGAGAEGSADEPEADELQWPADLVGRPRPTTSQYVPLSKGEPTPVRAPTSMRGVVTTEQGSKRVEKRAVGNMPTQPGHGGSTGSKRYSSGV